MDYALLDQANEECIMDGGTFDGLKLEFQRTLQELRADPHAADLEDFVREYAKLHQTLLKSHENEKRLFRKSQEQSRQILSLTQNIKDGLRRQKDDQLMIEALEQEAKDSWDKVRSSHLRETKQKDYLTQLKREVEVLNKLLRHGLNIQSSSKHRIEVLEDERNALTERIQTVDEEVNGLIKEVAFQRNRIIELQQTREKYDRRVAFLELEMSKREGEYEAQRELRLQREGELSETREHIRERLAVVAELKSQQDALDAEIAEAKAAADLELRSAQEEHEASTALMRERNELRDAADTQDQSNDQLRLKISNLKDKLRSKQREESDLAAQLERVQREADKIRRQWEEVNFRRADTESERAGYVGQVSESSREIDALKRAAERDKTRVDDLTHQRNILSKNVAAQARANDAAEHELTLESNRSANEQRKKRSHRAQALMQRQSMYTLEREIAHYRSDTAEANHKTRLALEEIHVREEEGRVLEETISGLNDKIKATRLLWSAVEQDRNRKVKGQQQYVEMISSSRQTFTLIQKSIMQLKEETRATDKKIQAEYVEVENAKKKSDSLQRLLKKKAEQISRRERELARKKAAMTKLSEILREAEEERLSQQNEIETVTNDRDVLSQQLIKRNEDMSGLVRKISVQQNQINLGRSEYDERVSDVELLQAKLTELSRKKIELTEQLSVVPDFRRQVHSLRRSLLRERTRIRSLQDELTTTLNVHRWRKIEGSQPSLFRMIERFHALQRQLIKKNEEIIQTDILIQEKEKLYLELKNLILKQPGAEVSEQLRMYKQQLRSKTKGRRQLEQNLKQTGSDLSVAEAAGERLEEEILRLKEEYFRRKRVQYEPPANVDVM